MQEGDSSRSFPPAADTLSTNPMEFPFPVRKESDEVLYVESDFVSLGRHDLKQLTRLALANPRQRARLCTHLASSDSLHEMLIVHGKAAYVRPHRHLNRCEGLSVLEGSADMIIFSDLGEIKEVIAMDSESFYQRFNAPLYHMLLIRSESLAFYEATSGPFNRADTDFAPWSPPESDPGAVSLYLEKIEDQITTWRERRK